jgi:hypothetical protein
MRIVAHAFGARYDLPIPLLLFVLGGGVVVVLSFWLLSRRDDVEHDEVSADAMAESRAVADGVRSPTQHRGFGFVGLGVLGFVIWAGLVGSQEIAENIDPTTFWLIAWIVVPLSCGLFGDWTRSLNPFAFLATLADRPGLRRILLGSSEPIRWPRRLGWWPAVLFFFLGACGELIFNLTLTVPRNTAIALGCYAIVSTLAGLLFGAEWLRKGEIFSVLFSTWGRLGYYRCGAAGRRGFGGGLDAGFDPAISRVCFVLLLLISVNFDGLLATPSWNRFENRAPGALATHPARLETFRTLTFVALAVAVAVVFGLFAAASLRASKPRRPRTSTAPSLRPTHGLAGLLPSLLPIAFGYLLVHNLQYVLVNSQLMLPLIGNPVGKNWWPLHPPYPFNDSYEIHRSFLPSAFYWYVGVGVIVAVHVGAIVVARRHLERRALDSVAARRSEYPWLVAMAGYTMLSLWLIAQPLVKENAKPAPQQAASPTSSGISMSGA